jgi:glycosyltransferase involved in cell wall biosynthesis
MRGGEKVLEALCRLLPEADLFTLFYEPEEVSPLIRSRKVTASFLNPLRGFHRSLLPLMPYALEHFDLRGYELVVSIESGPAKGVLTSASTRHVCYCNTPMRYLWDLYPDYVHEWTPNPIKRLAMAWLSHHLRVWDYSTAARVDEFVANSENVRRRIRKVYRRESEVIHPPVPVESFYWKPPEDYYLAVAEFVPYKRLDIAVRACTESGRKLKLVGGGPEYGNLRKLAGGGVEFCGRVSDRELRELYARCRALVMPGEEDFGITCVEALASGKPLVALARGGVVEIAGGAGSGVLYGESNAEALQQALARFEALEHTFRPADLQAASRKFDESVFASRMSGLLGRDSTARQTAV